MRRLAVLPDPSCDRDHGLLQIVGRDKHLGVEPVSDHSMANRLCAGVEAASKEPVLFRGMPCSQLLASGSPQL